MGAQLERSRVVRRAACRVRRTVTGCLAHVGHPTG